MSDKNENSGNVELVPVSSLDLIIKAEVDMQISTAKAFPRSIKQFIDKAMSIATINESVAASCNFAMPRGGKIIEGPSVRLAEIVASTYGNLRVGARVIANDGKKITAQGICHDLESNVCVTAEIERRITDKSGKTFNEDMQIMTGNAACAIALRNAIFKGVPRALFDEVYEKTKQVAKGTAETLPVLRAKAIAYFTEQGIKEKQIVDVLGLKKIEDIDLDKLATLRSMVSAVRNGEATLEGLFDGGEITLEDLQLLFDQKKGFITDPVQLSNIQRVINTKEKQSYKKTWGILEALK